MEFRKPKREEAERPNYILFTDLDGTLNLDDKGLPNTIKLMKEVGGMLVIVSGRTIGDIEEEFTKRNLELPDYIVGDNGGCIYDTKTKEFLSRKTLKPKKVKNIINHFQEKGGNSDLIRYTDGENVYASKTPEVRQYYKDKDSVNFYVNIRNRILDEKVISKVTLAGTKESMEEMKKYVETLGYWSDMGATKFPEEKYHNQRLDIAAKNINKGEAVKEINKMIKPKYGYACFGNGWNDLTMFNEAIKDHMKVFIMESAPQELIKQMKEKKGDIYIIPDDPLHANRKIAKLVKAIQDKFQNKEENKPERLPNVERVKVNEEQAVKNVEDELNLKTQSNEEQIYPDDQK